MNEEKPPQPVETISWMGRVVIYAALLLVLLVAFVPMWLEFREWSSSVSHADYYLSVARIAYGQEV
ncbi:MAG: hypothetical protein EHM23_36145 [Acidobacteria bacterium]|nr:MAG: hypothetical protein EHM23_36145 [Acidobacteriota bacterium]